MRKLAIDLGDIRMGLAISDPMGIIASPLETYKRVSWEADTEHIRKITEEKQVDTIVIGLPVNMDGSHGERVEKTKIFADKLKAVPNVKIVFQDERMTTLEAERALREGELSLAKRKELVDMVAAQIILKTYLSKLK